MCTGAEATLIGSGLGLGGAIYGADKAASAASSSRKQQDKVLAMKQQLLDRRKTIVDQGVQSGLFDYDQSLARYNSDADSALKKAQRNNMAVQISQGFDPNSERSQRTNAYITANMAKTQSGNAEAIRQNAFKNRLNAEQAINPDFTQELSVYGQRAMQEQSKADSILASIPGMVGSLLPYLVKGSGQGGYISDASAPLGLNIGSQQDYVNYGDLPYGYAQSGIDGNVYWEIPRGD